MGTLDQPALREREILLRRNQLPVGGLAMMNAFLIILFGVLGACAETSKLPSRCFFCRCPRNQEPQCGSDGRTYSNPCMLNCAKQRCADMTQGLTARAGACSTSPLLNAVKQAATGNGPKP